MYPINRWSLSKYTHMCSEQHLHVASGTTFQISQVSRTRNYQGILSLWELPNIIYGTCDIWDSNMVNPPFPARNPIVQGGIRDALIDIVIVRVLKNGFSRIF